MPLIADLMKKRGLGGTQPQPTINAIASTV